MGNSSSLQLLIEASGSPQRMKLQVTYRVGGSITLQSTLPLELEEDKSVHRSLVDGCIDGVQEL